MDKSIMQSLSYRLSHDFCSAHWTRFFFSYFFLSTLLSLSLSLIIGTKNEMVWWLFYVLLKQIGLKYFLEAQFDYTHTCKYGRLWQPIFLSFGYGFYLEWQMTFVQPIELVFPLLLLSFYSALSPIIWTRNEMVWWLFYVLFKPWVEIYSEWVFLFYPYCLFVYLTLTNFVEPIESFFFLILLSYYSPLSPNSHSILKRFMLLQA